MRRYSIGGYEGDDLNGVVCALVADADKHPKGVVWGRLYLRELAMAVLLRLDAGEREEAEALDLAVEPGFARCRECGNLAMNPLPNCSTCGGNLESSHV